VATYSLRFKPTVEKDLLRILRPAVSKIITRIDQLPANPFPSQSLKLHGAEHLYRLRVGDYRVVYEVDSVSCVIVIHYVRHRREVYRALR
jgi:mRNA interferase RelE/StbE